MTLACTTWTDDQLTKRNSPVIHHGGDELTQRSKGPFRHVGEHAVAAVWEALEAHQVRRQAACDLLAEGGRRDGVTLAGQHQHRAAYGGKRRTEVHAPLFMSRAGEMQGDLVAHDGAAKRVPVRRRASKVERKANPEVVRLGRGRAGEPVSFGNLLGFGATDAPERLEHGREVHLGSGADKNELARVIGMTGRVGLGDEAAEGGAEHDGPLDAEGVAEAPHVVAPLREVPRFRVVTRTTAAAAMVEVDDLREVRGR